ncbi:hypothetical protein CUR178_04779 [Leishmania enriettii]|uniref:Uncharacterized protein n=1 Tax=Leishmania enriettii TaxID=5663 RepID=A0A836KQK8_LEIEN|nr:hypothetical protein CUR178_04779 [Leishmania enriettii]
MPAKRLAALKLKGDQGSDAGNDSTQRGGPTTTAAVVTKGAQRSYRFPVTNEEEGHPGIHAHATAFSRGVAISSLLTPPTLRAASIGSRDCCDAKSSRSDNSSLFHSCYSSGARSSAERAGTASPTLTSTHCRSYRHNPYVASPGAAGSPLMPESPASAFCAEHESARGLSIGGGHVAGEQGCRCIVRSRQARSSSRSTSGCSRTLAGPITGVGYHASSLLQPQQLAAAFPPHHSVESLSREGSFLGRSDPSSVGQSCRSSPAAAAAPLAMLLASASSFRGAQHGAHHHHPPTLCPSSAIYGAGGATPETSALYQSLSSANVTVSTSSNNPYIGVRMTPETALLQPQMVAHPRGFETGPRAAALEAIAHSLSLYEAQPQEPLPPWEPNQHEIGTREGQQHWMRAKLPTQVMPTHAHGFPATAAVGESDRAYSCAARAASADEASMSKCLPASMLTALNPVEGSGIEPDTLVHRQEPQEQKELFSLPSYSSTPHEGWMCCCSPCSATQQQGMAPKQLVDHISLFHGVTMPAARSTAISFGGTSASDASRSHNDARDAARQFLPLSTIAETVSPVPVLEMELATSGANSSCATALIVDDEMQHRQTASRARSPDSPYTEASRALPRHAAHPSLSTPLHYRDTCADALNSKHTNLLSDKAPRPRPNSASAAEWPHYRLQHIRSSAAGACSVEGDKAHSYSDGGASPARLVTEDTPAMAGTSQSRVWPSVPLVSAAATGDTCGPAPTDNERHWLGGAVAARVRGENDAENTDGEGKGGNDDEGSVTGADAAQKGKKKKRAHRNRKAKMLEDLPAVTSMKYLPPPPPPVSPMQLNPTGAPVNDASSTLAFNKYYAILLRWYTRLLADEADFVDIVSARSFDAATAAAALSAEARQARDGSHAAAGKPPSPCPRQSPRFGLISPLVDPAPPSLMPKTVPAYFGGTGDSSGSSAEVHVRCPRIEHYMAPCDIPAELRLFRAPNTAGKNLEGIKSEAIVETQVAGADTMAMPHSVKDVPSAVRWARALETWWFCYVFPHVAHTRHLPRTTQPLAQPVSISPVSLTFSHTGSGGAGYDYPYGWPTAMPQSIIMTPIQGVYGGHSNVAMSGGHPVMGNGMCSSVYGTTPMHHQMPPPLPSMPPGYLMGVYSTY